MGGQLAPVIHFQSCPNGGCKNVRTIRQSGKKRATEEKCSVIFNNECSIKIVFRDYFGVAL